MPETTDKKTRAPKKTLAERFEEQVTEEVNKYDRDKEKLDKRADGIKRMREALTLLKANSPAPAPKPAAKK